jgi:hypothetical protein
MDREHDCVLSITHGRRDWFLKVRVVRLWKEYDVVEPFMIKSIEMVLTDRYVSAVDFAFSFIMCLCLFSDGCLVMMFCLCAGP